MPRVPSTVVHDGHHRSAAATPCPWRWGPLLGRGRWTEVYRAAPAGDFDPANGDYAIKVPRAELATDPCVARQLQREARVARAADSPHVVSVLDHRLRATGSYVVMPYIHGRTLRQWFGAGRPFQLAHALWITRQIAEGLTSLHQAGWLHADVKPENMIVSPKGHATLIDLGLAVPLNRDEPPEAPLQGSLAYLAPEGYSIDVRRSAQTDSYALGVTAYELLAGRRPFPESSAEELARAHVERTPPPLRRFAPHVPGDVATLVHQLLSKLPLRRPVDEELVDRLTSLEVRWFQESSARQSA